MSIAGLFANFSLSVHRNHEDNLPEVLSSSLLNVYDCSMSVVDVRRLISQHVTSKGCDSDRTPRGSQLMNCEILYVVLFWYNPYQACSIDFVFFPGAFKRSFILPIHKNGSRNDVRN